MRHGWLSIVYYILRVGSTQKDLDSAMATKRWRQTNQEALSSSKTTWRTATTITFFVIESYNIGPYGNAFSNTQAQVSSSESSTYKIETETQFEQPSSQVHQERSSSMKGLMPTSSPPDICRVSRQWFQTSMQTWTKAKQRYEVWLGQIIRDIKHPSLIYQEFAHQNTYNLVISQVRLPWISTAKE